eukprot:scaffold362347_cov36-Prasinocladus_malaysianus.AAC.2
MRVCQLSKQNVRGSSHPEREGLWRNHGHLSGNVLLSVRYGNRAGQNLVLFKHEYGLSHLDEEPDIYRISSTTLGTRTARPRGSPEAKRLT